jgi:Zc3h12a-like Ribonuclease NYN domain/S1 RNA binding domain
MQPAMKIDHVVIDGSNIATEGRDAPSLAQLDEAVQAFIEEYSPRYITVVVDATFPNRIDAKERTTYEDAVNANELITPPAGAIGRGDAFVLQIARRAGAAILSNDSFQEFHGDHPWLFDRGRLIGGKPVPHVGWVFMERAPVRGPTSRRAVSEARKVAQAADKVAKQVAPLVEAEAGVEAPPGPDGEAPKPAKARRTRAPRSAKAAVADTPRDDTAASAPPADDGQAPAPRAARGGRIAEPYNEALPFIEFVGQHAVGSEVEATVERFSSHGAYVTVGPARAYVPLRNLAEPAPRSAKELLRPGESRRFVVVSIDPPRRGIDLALPGVVDVPEAPPADLDAVAAEARADTTVAAAPAKRASRSRKKAAAREAPEAPAEAAEAPEPAKRAPRSRKKAAAPEAPEPAKRASRSRKKAAPEAPAEGTTAPEPAKRASRSRKKAAAVPAEAAAAPEAAAQKPSPAKKPAAKKATGRKPAGRKQAAGADQGAARAGQSAAAALANGERPAPTGRAGRKKATGRSAASTSRATAPAAKKAVSRRSGATTRTSPDGATPGAAAGARPGAGDAG